MPIRQANDSLSRCDPSQFGGLYDISKPKKSVAKDLSTPSLQKDTLEICGEKLKKEAMERLRHTSKYVIFQNSFMRIGKYLFVAVAFPPYLLLYGLPKWIVVEALPILVSWVVTFVQKAQAKGKKIMEVLTQKVARFTQYLKQIVWIGLEPIMKMWSALQQGINRFRYTFQAAFNKVWQKSNISSFKERMTSLLKGMTEGVIKVGKKWSEWPAKLLSQFGEKIVRLRELPPKLMAKVKNQFQGMQETLLRWPRKWKTNFQTSQKAAKMTSDWIAGKSQFVSARLKRGLFAFGKQYSQTIQPKVSKLWMKWKSQLGRCGEQLSQKKKQILEVISKLEQIIKKLTFPQIHDSLIAFTSRLQISARWKKMIHKLLNHFVFKMALRISFTVFTRCSLMTLKVSNLIVLGVSYVVQNCAKAWTIICKISSKISNIIFSYVRSFFDTAGKWIRKTLYFFLLSLFMFAITLYWALRSCKKIMDIPFTKATKHVPESV